MYISILKMWVVLILEFLLQCDLTEKLARKAAGDVLYVRGAHAIRKLQYAKPHYSSFLDKDSYEELGAVRAQLLNDFNVPDFLANRTCTELNGYFGCRVTYSEESNEEGKVKGCSMFFA